MATTTLGGVTLPQPKYGHEGYEYTFVDKGALHELADGSLAEDFVNSRRMFTLRWSGVTWAGGIDDIATQYAAKGVQVFSPPTAATEYNVLIVPNSWRASAITDGAGDTRWDVEIQLAEVS